MAVLNGRAGGWLPPGTGPPLRAALPRVIGGHSLDTARPSFVPDATRFCVRLGAARPELPLIDLHNHTLPGIDDGPETMEDALEMARRAEADGIEIVAVSPHVIYQRRVNDTLEVRPRVEALQQAVDAAAIRVKFLPGGEIPMTAECLDWLNQDRLPTIGDNGRWILLEIPFGMVPFHLKMLLFELRSRGRWPILAHPERNVQIQRDLSILNKLAGEEDTPIQLTSHSLTGGHGQEARRCGLKLLSQARPVILATDAHDPDQRPPILSEGRDAAAQVVGRAAASMMVSDLPRAVLKGADLPLLPREAPGRGGLFQALKQRVFF